MLKGVKTQKAVLGILAMMLVALLAAGFLTPSTAVAAPPQPEGYPTEIDAVPDTQSISSSAPPNCPATASWTVYLSGGNGTYDVHVSYGDGDGRHWYNWTQTIHDGHTFCGCTSQTFHQTSSASSTGGGTGYDYTTVYYN